MAILQSKKNITKPPNAVDATDITVQFYESTGTLIFSPDNETKTIPANSEQTFSVTYTINSLPLKEGDNYTIYAKAEQYIDAVDPSKNENVLGNNSGFAVLSVVSSGGAIPIPETSILLLPLMLLGVLYFVWKDDKNETQTE